MKQTINFYDFSRAFKEIRPNNFTYNGLKALFNWFEELEEAGANETELDVIAICCEFTEFKNLTEFNEWYNTANPFDTVEQIEENTTVVLVEPNYSELSQYEKDHFLKTGNYSETTERGFIIQDF